MIFFFYGENSYAIHKMVEELRTKYIAKTGSDFNLEVFDMSEKSLKMLLNSVAVTPLFASSRLIIVRGLGANKEFEWIEELIKSVPASTIMVIEEREVDRRSKYFKALSKLKDAREFKALSTIQLNRWLINEVKRLDGEIDNSTVQLLIDRVGNDQWQLSQEIQKLVSYNPKISMKSIEKLVVPNVEQTIFELVDHAARKDLVQALAVYRHLAQDGVADQQILAMLNWQYRNLVLAKENSGRNQQWTAEFAISPFVTRKAAILAQLFDFDGLAAAYRAIVEADFAIKSGLLDSQSAITRLLTELTK